MGYQRRVHGEHTKNGPRRVKLITYNRNKGGGKRERKSSTIV